eukprot:scaffold1371_cov122-Isochrysis_galbana.AAC.5
MSSPCVALARRAPFTGARPSRSCCISNAHALDERHGRLAVATGSRGDCRRDGLGREWRSSGHRGPWSGCSSLHHPLPRLMRRHLPERHFSAPRCLASPRWRNEDVQRQRSPVTVDPKGLRKALAPRALPTETALRSPVKLAQPFRVPFTSMLATAVGMCEDLVAAREAAHADHGHLRVVGLRRRSRYPTRQRRNADAHAQIDCGDADAHVRIDVEAVDHDRSGCA